VIPVEGSYLNYTLRTPIGVVANCTPFNHPLMIMCKSLAAVLATGCVTVVKPSEYTPLTTLKLAKIFTDAGLPPGVFNIVNGLGASAGKMLAEHGDINKLVLTGGTEAGRIAGAAAAKVFAHQTMELGGKTPVMVFEDFDIDRAVNYAAFGAFIGAGQTCVCASRHIVQASIYDEFVEKLKRKTESIRIGDPFDAATQLGPVISARQRDRVLSYCGFGRDDGARLVTGGYAADVSGHENGYFVQPTATSRAPIAWRPPSRPASSGSTTTTGSTRRHPGAASTIAASGANSAPKASTTISTPRASWSRPMTRRSTGTATRQANDD
jgi:acyl-CoA reductase-like NAD-dependent aldehyde dehydrogenase